jgi:hypothetical protein
MMGRMVVFRQSLHVVGYSLGLLLVAPAALAQEVCFERVDTGTDMTGWHKSTTNPHGPGDGWTVENGAFVGRQTAGQQGGVLMTDRSYQDVEVIFQVKITWGCDSGFFFRTTEGARAYQVNVDHLAESGVGTIWGEGFSQELREIPYWLTDMGGAAIVAPDQDPPIFDLALWPTLWNPTDFNEIRARIEGNPPHMQVWVSGTKVMDFTDGMVRSEIDATGPLAIQVHNGGRWVDGGTVEFKNIRVRDLSVVCEEPEPSGGAGGGGGGGAGGGGSAGAATGGGGQAGLAGGGVSAGGTGGVGGTPAPPTAAGTSASTAGSGVSPAPAGGDAGGCGCRVGRENRGGAPIWLLLVAGVGALRLRRGLRAS